MSFIFIFIRMMFFGMNKQYHTKMINKTLQHFLKKTSSHLNGKITKEKQIYVHNTP